MSNLTFTRTINCFQLQSASLHPMIYRGSWLVYRGNWLDTDHEYDKRWAHYHVAGEECVITHSTNTHNQSHHVLCHVTPRKSSTLPAKVHTPPCEVVALCAKNMIHWAEYRPKHTESGMARTLHSHEIANQHVNNHRVQWLLARTWSNIERRVLVYNRVSWCTN